MGRHAVVIGASMAGLMAARVLADHFESVTVFERDPLAEAPKARKGVPQGRQTHAVLETCSKVLAELFPGFWAEMLAAGSIPMDTSHDWLWFHHGAWKARWAGGPITYGQSRPFLEFHVRRRLTRDCARVRLCQGDVVGLAHDSARQQVTGVSLRGEDGQKTVVEADLVVDASGRGTRAPSWLEELGYGRPLVEHVRIDICYASRIVEPPPEARDWKALIIYGKAPHEKRLSYIFPVEGGRWITTLGGYHGDHPTADEEGFLEFSRTLHRPEHYAALREARPVTPISLHRVPSDQRYYYERMERFPEGFVTVGDAICSFNPIFGQGMTTAALGAMTLGECLARHAAGQLKGFSRDFQRRTTRYNNVAWLLTTTEDLRYPETQGTRSVGLGALNWYKSQLLELCSVDPEVHRGFLELVHMRSGLEVLLTPGMLLKACLWGMGLRGDRSLAVSPPPGPPRAA